MEPVKSVLSKRIDIENDRVIDYFEDYCLYLSKRRDDYTFREICDTLESMKNEINLYLNFRDHIGDLNDEDTELYKYYTLIKSIR